MEAQALERHKAHLPAAIPYRCWAAARAGRGHARTGAVVGQLEACTRLNWMKMIHVMDQAAPATANDASLKRLQTYLWPTSNR